MSPAAVLLYGLYVLKAYQQISTVAHILLMLNVPV